MNKWSAGAFGVGLLALQGCAINAPYPDWMLKKADTFITKVEYLPDAELQEKCSFEERVAGCTKLITGEIYVLDAHGPAFKACVLRHERSHLYDFYVKGEPYEVTREHENWVQSICYTPRQTVASGRPPTPFLVAIFADPAAQVP